MRTRVHPLIVKQAVPLLPKKVQDFVFSDISQGEYNNRNYLDLIMLGSILEDDPKVASDVASPRVEHPLLRSLLQKNKVEHLHWVEHFWSSDLTDGLVIRAGYFRQLVSEVFGLDNIMPDSFNFLEQQVADAFATLVKGDNVLAKFRSAPQRADEYWKILVEQYRQGQKERAIINLGRVCHLLADVGTPAHVHGDAHIGYSLIGALIKNPTIKFNTAIDDDDYEDYVADYLDKSRDHPKYIGQEYGKRKNLPAHWCPSDDDEMIFDSRWTLREYFIHVAKQASLYDSDNADGKGKGHPYRWQRCYIINPIKFIMMERDLNNDLTDKACELIARALIPLSVQATAGIIAKFYYEVTD